MKVVCPLRNFMFLPFSLHHISPEKFFLKPEMLSTQKRIDGHYLSAHSQVFEETLDIVYFILYFFSLLQLT